MILELVQNHIFWRENVKILSSFTQLYNGCHYVTLLICKPLVVLLILLHGIISLPEATSCDKVLFCCNICGKGLLNYCSIFWWSLKTGINSVVGNKFYHASFLTQLHENINNFILLTHKWLLIRSVPWIFIATFSCDEPRICSITFAGLPDSKAWGQKRKKYYGVEDIGKIYLE